MEKRQRDAEEAAELEAAELAAARALESSSDSGTSSSWDEFSEPSERDLPPPTNLIEVLRRNTSKDLNEDL